jgi:hypothetical protein
MISDAVRDIEPELRELFTKIVERDPQEAVKMLEPYPDEFVVKMLELLPRPTTVGLASPGSWNFPLHVRAIRIFFRSPAASV